MAILGERSWKLKALWGDDTSHRASVSNADPSTSAIPPVEKSLFRLTAELKNLLHRDRFFRGKKTGEVAAEDVDPDRKSEEENLSEMKNAIRSGRKNRATEFLPITPEREDTNRRHAESKKGTTYG